MNKQFVTYDIALKLKKIGFDEKCFCFFLWDGTELMEEFKNKLSQPLYSLKTNTELINHLSAPLWQQVIDWFREKHNYNITYNILENGNYVFKGGDFQSNFKVLSKRLCFYESREHAILKVIELFKNK